MRLRGVILVEGTSDRHAVETLARRRGRDLQAEGVAIVPMGGYGNLPRLLPQYPSSGPRASLTSARGDISSVRWAAPTVASSSASGSTLQAATSRTS